MWARVAPVSGSKSFLSTAAAVAASSPTALDMDGAQDPLRADEETTADAAPLLGEQQPMPADLEPMPSVIGAGA